MPGQLDDWKHKLGHILYSFNVKGKLRHLYMLDVKTILGFVVEAACSLEMNLRNTVAILPGLYKAKKMVHTNRVL